MEIQKVKQQKIIIRHKHCQWDCPVHNHFAKELRKYRCFSSDQPCIQYSPSSIFTKKHESKTIKKKSEKLITTSSHRLRNSKGWTNKPDQLQRLIKVYMMKLKTGNQNDNTTNKEDSCQRNKDGDNLQTIKYQMHKLPTPNETIDIKPFVCHKESAQEVDGNQQEIEEVLGHRHQKQWGQIKLQNEKLPKNQITSLDQQVEALKNNVKKIEAALQGNKTLCQKHPKLSKSRYIEKLPQNQNFNKLTPQEGLNYKMYQDERIPCKAERSK